MRRHPIFVLLDNATARQLAIGACVALGIVGLFAGVRYINEPSLDPPSAWLTGATESELRSAMEQLRSEPGTVDPPAARGSTTPIRRHRCSMFPVRPRTFAPRRHPAMK
ncbi:MAG: hypothetical protein U5Q44_09410 [Dehalococcoidia bacterium]|nr:hypothetical protein [Dehalococcoidia bacterium]